MKAETPSNDAGEPAPGIGAWSDDAANPVDLTEGVFDDPPDNRPVCTHCDKPFDWSGRGRPPKYCLDHRTPTSRKPPARKAPAKSKAKDSSIAYGMAWAGIGYGIQLRVPDPVGPPVGRVMQFQAADAGPRLEKLLGKLVEKVPFLKSLGKETELGRELTALFGPPLITAAIASGRIPAAAAEPIFASIMRPIIAGALEAAQSQATSISELSEADQEVMAAVGEFMRAVFGAPAQPTQQEVRDGYPEYS